MIIENPVTFEANLRATELPDSSFLITGGNKNGNFVQDTYHFFSKCFYKKNKMSMGRSRHCTVYHKGFVLVFGGLDSNGAIADCEAFDMNSDEWVPIAPLPTAKFDAGCCKFGEDKAYVFGGTQQLTNGEENDVN